MRHLPLLLSAFACNEESPIVIGPGTEPTISTPTSVTDLQSADVGVSSGYQGGQWFGHFLRGRAALIGDLDRDNRQDVWIGNPGDESYVLFNRTAEPGNIRFELGPVLSDEHLSWGGAMADYDNDGDRDLFVAGGGNESREWDQMWRNEVIPSGTFSMTDVTVELRLAGPVDENGDAVKLPTANANAVDFDNDGLIDVFANTDIVPATDIPELALKPGVGKNVLWRQNATGFEDVTDLAGLTSTEATQHSMFLDWDNDGDQDLYENTNRCYQHLWRNLLVETGEARFEDVTREMTLGEGDLRFPYNAFSSAVGDFNHDGWEDIFVFVRAFEELEESPYHDGHVLLINAQGKGFVDVAPLTGVNDPYISWDDETFRDHTGGGVMGSTIGDINVDGIPDVYVGQGGPSAGTPDLFFVSSGLQEVEVEGLGRVRIPIYEHRSDLIDWPVPEDPASTLVYPPYPYRTHAVNMVDFDRDGIPEITVQNGGPKAMPDVVQEPARLFQFSLPSAPRWFAVTLIGNGTTVNRSAIGAKVVATVRREVDGYEWTLTRWLHGGNGFSANNGFELHFGLADADALMSADVYWPDGTVTPINPLPQFGDTVIVDQELGETTKITDRSHL